MQTGGSDQPRRAELSEADVARDTVTQRLPLGESASEGFDEALAGSLSLEAALRGADVRKGWRGYRLVGRCQPEGL